MAKPKKARPGRAGRFYFRARAYPDKPGLLWLTVTCDRGKNGQAGLLCGFVIPAVLKALVEATGWGVVEEASPLPHGRGEGLEGAPEGDRTPRATQLLLFPGD